MTPEEKVRRALLNRQAHSRAPSPPDEAERLLFLARDLEAFAANLRRLAVEKGAPAQVE